MFRTIDRQQKPKTPSGMVNELFARLKGPEPITIEGHSSDLNMSNRHVERARSNYSKRRRQYRRLAIHSGTNIRSTWF